MLNFFFYITNKVNLFFVSFKNKNSHIVLNEIQDFLLQTNIKLLSIKESYNIQNHTNIFTFFKSTFASALLNLLILLISFFIKMVFFLIKPSRYLADNHLKVYWHYVCVKKTTKRLLINFFFKLRSFYAKSREIYVNRESVIEHYLQLFIASKYAVSLPMFWIYLIFLNAYYNVLAHFFFIVYTFPHDMMGYEPSTEFAFHYIYGFIIIFGPFFYFIIFFITHIVVYKSLFIYIFFSYLLLKSISRIPLFYFSVKLSLICGSFFIIYFYCYKAKAIYLNYALYYFSVLSNTSAFIYLYSKLVDYTINLYSIISAGANNFSIMQNFFGLHIFFIICSTYILYNITTSVSNLSIFLKTFMFFMFTVIYMFFLNLDTWACFLIIVESSALFLLVVLLNRVKLYNAYFFSKKNIVILLCILVYVSLIVSYSDHTNLNYFYINFYTKVLKNSNSDFIGIVPLIFNNTSLFFFIITTVSIVTIFIVLKFNISFSKKHFFLKKSKNAFIFKKIKNYLYANVDVFFLKVMPSVNKWFKK